MAFPYKVLMYIWYMCVHCGPGAAFRDRTGGPRRHRRAADVFYSHLSGWDRPAGSETLLQHQTWRDGQLFCSQVLRLRLCVTPGFHTVTCFTATSKLIRVLSTGAMIQVDISIQWSGMHSENIDFEIPPACLCPLLCKHSNSASAKDNKNKRTGPRGSFLYTLSGINQKCWTSLDFGELFLLWPQMGKKNRKKVTGIFYCNWLC